MVLNKNISMKGKFVPFLVNCFTFDCFCLEEEINIALFKLVVGQVCGMNYFKMISNYVNKNST